jgi:hypothetical protein
MNREIEDSHAITTSKLVLETAFSSQRLLCQRRTLGVRQRRILAVLETGSFSLTALMRHLGEGHTMSPLHVLFKAGTFGRLNTMRGRAGV